MATETANARSSAPSAVKDLWFLFFRSRFGCRLASTVASIRPRLAQILLRRGDGPPQLGRGPRYLTRSRRRAKRALTLAARAPPANNQKKKSEIFNRVSIALHAFPLPFCFGRFVHFRCPTGFPATEHSSMGHCPPPVNGAERRTKTGKQRRRGPYFDAATTLASSAAVHGVLRVLVAARTAATLATVTGAALLPHALRT